MNAAVNNPTILEILATLRRDVTVQLDLRCPEEDLHRALVLAENLLIHLLEKGADAIKAIDHLTRVIQRLFSIRIRLADHKDRLRIRQERENERKESRRLKEQKKEEERLQAKKEKEAQKTEAKKARETAKEPAKSPLPVSPTEHLKLETSNSREAGETQTSSNGVVASPN